MARGPLSVVVPTRDRPGMLAACLAALNAELQPQDELLVADSASTGAAEVAQVVAEAGARLVRCEVKGAALARNAGWRAAVHEDVVFVDDDMRVLPGWADALAAPDATFVVGRTVAPSSYDGDPATVTYGRPAEVVDRDTVGSTAASNNLLVRRSALVSSGGFDERLGPGTWFEAGEDLELLDRLLAVGATGRFAHDAVAVHEQWRHGAARQRLQLAYGKGMGARTAAAFRRSPRDGWRLLPEMLRLKGLRTAGRRLAGPAVPAQASDAPPDVSGWVGPVLWRLGALLGFAAGLVRLRPR